MTQGGEIKMPKGQGWKNPNAKRKKPRSKKPYVTPKKKERRGKEKERGRSDER